MWTLLCPLVLLSSVCSGSLIPLYRDLDSDIAFAKYSTKKVSYDLDVLAARTNILGLELQYTVFNLVLNIETLLYELLFPSDAERVVGEINKTAESVLTNVVRLDNIILRLDNTIIVVENDLQFDVEAVEGDLPLLESYLTNFNLTYDIGKENVILATNLIILTLQRELEDLTDPEVDIVFKLADQIKEVLLVEQGYLDNARMSFDKNSVTLLDALKTVVESLHATTSSLPPKATMAARRADTSTSPTSNPTASPASSSSFIPTTSPKTTTISFIPTTSTTPTLITDRTSTSTPYFTSDRTTTTTPFFTTDRTTTATRTTDTTRTLHTVTTPPPTVAYSN